MNENTPPICTIIILMPLFWFIWMIIRDQMKEKARAERIKKEYEARKKAGLIKLPTSSSYSDWDDDEDEDDDDDPSDGRWVSNSGGAIIPFPGIFEIREWREKQMLDKQLSERE